MEGYHKFVFDVKKRRFVGRFEEMYQSEKIEGYDSWHERDLRPLRKIIPYIVLNQYNFNRIFEIGCGKGSFTQFLKKKNNYVIAVDISKTAIDRAKMSYPDIDYISIDVTLLDLPELLNLTGGVVDLTMVMGTAAYIESWPNLMEKVSKISKYLFIAEYIPSNPIGFVKSINHLILEVEKHFKIITKIILDDEHCFLFAEVKG